MKENALSLIESQLGTLPPGAARNLITSVGMGTYFGFANLEVHKQIFDQTLRSQKYDEVEYLLLTSGRRPNVAFSGLIYPDYDFSGKHLQDLGDYKARLKLMTFSSAWIADGWGYLFAWHKDSSDVCRAFLDSLIDTVRHGAKYQDYLFRLALGCENHAISPDWWEALAASSKEAIVERISDAVDLMAETEATYLSAGFEGIADWHFAEVISNIGIQQTL